MLARLIKNELGERFRSAMNNSGIPTQESYKGIVISHLNLVLGKDPSSSLYWAEMKAKLLSKFPQGLFPHETCEQFKLEKSLSILDLFLRVQKLTAVDISPPAMEALRKDPSSFLLVDSDLLDIGCRVKRMNISALSSAIVLSSRASSMQGKEYERLFKLAFEKFDAAASASPSNLTTFRYWADALIQYAYKPRSDSRETLRILHSALERYEDAFQEE